MAYAVTHILIPLILVAIYRDYIHTKKHKKKFSIHYVYLAGLGGVLPDLDIAIYFVLKYFGFAFENIHRTFTHSLFIPLIFVFLYFIFKNYKIELLSRHKMKLSYIFLALAFGSLTHIILDVTLKGEVMLLSPFLTNSFGLNLVDYLPLELSKLSLPILDGILLILFLAYLELKHKISDFI